MLDDEDPDQQGAGGQLSARVRNGETGKTRYIAAQPARKGPNEVSSCSALHQGMGRANAPAARLRAPSEEGRSRPLSMGVFRVAKLAKMPPQGANEAGGPPAQGVPKVKIPPCKARI